MNARPERSTASCAARADAALSTNSASRALSSHDADSGGACSSDSPSRPNSPAARSEVSVSRLSAAATTFVESARARAAGVMRSSVVTTPALSSGVNVVPL